MEMKYLIIDSDATVGKELLWLLQEHATSIITWVKDANELEKHEELKVDVIFVRMKCWSHKVVKFIEERAGEVEVIFISGRNPKYFNEVKTLVKHVVGCPLDVEEIEAVLKSLILQDNVECNNWQFFFINYENRYLKLYYDEVVKVEQSANDVSIYTTSKQYKVATTFKKLFEHVPKKRFQFANKQLGTMK